MTAYLPVIDLLRGYFKVQDRDDYRGIREKITGKLLGRLGRAYTFMGNFHRAIDLWRWTIESLKGKLKYEQFGMATFPAPAARFFLTFCLAGLGELDCYQQAITLAQELGMRPLVARCHLGLGRLLQRF